MLTTKFWLKLPWRFTRYEESGYACKLLIRSDENGACASFSSQTANNHCDEGLYMNSGVFFCDRDLIGEGPNLMDRKWSSGETIPFDLSAAGYDVRIKVNFCPRFLCFNKTTLVPDGSDYCDVSSSIEGWGSILGWYIDVVEVITTMYGNQSNVNQPDAFPKLYQESMSSKHNTCTPL